MTNAEFDLLEAEFSSHLVGNRTESTAMLAWFLENVWREEPGDVETALCDGSNDKGIDAIVVDHDAREITVLQAKHRRSANPSQGDGDLKTFLGVATYFRGPEGIDALLSSAPNDELRLLIERQNIRALLADEPAYTVRFVFITNAEKDASAISFIASHEGGEPGLELWDRIPLASVAERTQRPGLVPGTFSLRPAGEVIAQSLGDDTNIVVALISAPELVRLPGISDFTLFALNVRLSLGRTRINKELASSIVQEREQHSLFPAFHNGLTILTQGLEVDAEGIHLDGISVVNGCQSLVALHANQQQLTPDLKLIVKMVQLGADPALADTITYRSNNQNPVNIRDQRANDAVQRDLQKQVGDLYGEFLFFSIRRGEQTPSDVGVFDNQSAAQLITAIWLREPWNAVRKLKLFDDDYRRIFSRHIDAHKLYFAFRFNELIEQRRSDLRPELSASFAAVRFSIAYLAAEVARQNGLGAEFLDTPERWLPEREAEVLLAFAGFVEHVVTELNYFAQAREEERIEDPKKPAFDPKVAFKSQKSIREMEHQVVTSTKAVARRFDDFLFSVAPER